MAGKIKYLSRSDGVTTTAPESLVVSSSQVSFNVLNAVTNQVISGVSFSSASNRSGVFVIDIVRQDAGNYYHEVFQCSCWYDSDAADWFVETTSHGDTSGVSFDMTAAGALNYTSTNMTGGSYVGTGRVANIIKILV